MFTLPRQGYVDGVMYTARRDLKLKGRHSFRKNLVKLGRIVFLFYKKTLA